MRSAFAARSNNRKLTLRGKGRAYATHASQASCDPSCALYRRGCYAERGNQGMFVTAQLNKSAAVRADTIARAEAASIDALPSDTRASLLRLHVVGDCRTASAASIVSAAATRWMVRTGAAAYTYTHSWREVPRRAWGTISVLASCESIQDVKRAFRRGYATALVVPTHGSGKASVVDGVRLVPCPAQTRGVTCDTCRLCFDDQALRARHAVIIFAAHGNGKRKVIAALA
jgi:hypothetical protein